MQGPVDGRGRQPGTPQVRLWAVALQGHPADGRFELRLPTARLAHSLSLNSLLDFLLSMFQLLRRLTL